MPTQLVSIDYIAHIISRLIFICQAHTIVGPNGLMCSGAVQKGGRREEEGRGEEKEKKGGKGDVFSGFQSNYLEVSELLSNKQLSISCNMLFGGMLFVSTGSIILSNWYLLIAQACAIFWYRLYTKTTDSTP